MELSQPFDMPDEVLVDPQTGLAMNLPITVQEYPGWWNREPEKYAALKLAREKAGIVIDDFPKGTDRIVSTSRPARMTRPE